MNSKTNNQHPTLGANVGVLINLVLLTLFLATCLGGKVFADEEKAPVLDELLAHPEVQGALAVIDAWVEGKQHYDRVPGISVGIVRDQDLMWAGNYGYSNLATK